MVLFLLVWERRGGEWKGGGGKICEKRLLPILRQLVGFDGRKFFYDSRMLGD